MEREFDVEAVIVRYYCDEPGCDGEMVRHGDSFLPTGLIQCPHRCSECGAQQNFTEIYPKTVFRQR